MPVRDEHTYMAALYVPTLSDNAFCLPGSRFGLGVDVEPFAQHRIIGAEMISLGDSPLARQA
jgi:hypothetical protein